MEFLKFKKLGRHKFHKIVSELMRGSAPTLVAKMIVDEWGDCADTPKDTLVHVLRYLRVCILDLQKCQEHPSSSSSKAQAEQAGKPLKGLPDPLHLMSELVMAWRDRIVHFVEIERLRGRPMPELTRMMRQYGKLLVSYQVMRFARGIDEYELGATQLKEPLHGRRLNKIVREYETKSRFPILNLAPLTEIRFLPVFLSLKPGGHSYASQSEDNQKADRRWRLPVSDYSLFLSSCGNDRHPITNAGN